MASVAEAEKGKERLAEEVVGTGVEAVAETMTVLGSVGVAGCMEAMTVSGSVVLVDAVTGNRARPCLCSGGSHRIRQSMWRHQHFERQS